MQVRPVVGFMFWPLKPGKVKQAIIEEYGSWNSKNVCT
jgi:hypothetical protein